MRFLPIMLVAVCLTGSLTVLAQVPCSNPVQLLSVLVNNTSCGNSNGTVLLNLSGNYTFEWSPNVSISSVASNLAAGVYSVKITRNGEPACVLDTFFVVSNTDGPIVQVSNTIPSNCLASNGAATLSPVSLNYTWSNGEIGAVNDGLNSGNYGVTATDPNSGCFTPLVVTIPNVNPLAFVATVTKPAKCGRSTGQVSFEVSGGSGVYSYSLGGTMVNGLPPGAGSGLVVDNISGCQATANFVIPDVAATGTVDLIINNPICAGGLGNVTVAVTPGQNFSQPYTFSITSDTGVPQGSAGALPAGKYLVFVVDADSCALPTKAFEITEPPAISTQATILPGDCSDGGTIDLTITGGTGTFLSDWSDVAGFVNPTDRQHLLPGRYNVVVYDSLFCKDTLSDLLMLSTCSQTDTFHLVVTVGQTGEFCTPLPSGLSLAETSVSLQNPAVTLSALGTWALQNKCLRYTALGTPAFQGDVICLRVQSPVIQEDRLVCIAVHILPFAPSTETVLFTTQIQQNTVGCGNIPSALNPQVIFPLNVPALNGNDAFGQYNIQTGTGCMDYTAYTSTGYNVDSIAIAVCDIAQQQCHIISYLPTILPFVDCSGGIIGADNFTLPTSDCVLGASQCLQIPYSNILNFSILDNNKPYTQGALGCQEGTVVNYALAQLPNSGLLAGGPYHLDEWFINGQVRTGVFSNADELVLLMNQLDPSPGWNTENFQNIIGGNPSNTYGPLRITAASGLFGEAPASLKSAALGSDLRFSTGMHTLILRKIQTGCADTVQVNVECFDCPPVHEFEENIFGNIEWLAPSCAADTLFCTNIPVAEAANWTITDAFIPFTNFGACGNSLAFRFDTGYHEMRLRNNLTTCEYTIQFFFDCRKAAVDTIYGTVVVGKEASLCVDTSLLTGQIISILHICPEGNDAPNATLSYDEQNWCALVTGLTPGKDTFCLQICNENGQCATILAFLEVLEAGSDRLQPYNGISPNGDGANDTWVIPGLEQFPKHEVRVFNRWGNLVFKQKAYQNDWDGTWNGQLLPDGTYYYVIDLGDGDPPVKGYLELVR